MGVIVQLALEAIRDNGEKSGKRDLELDEFIMKKKEILADDQYFQQAEVKRRSTNKGIDKISTSRKSYVLEAENDEVSSESDDDPDVSSMKRAINIFYRHGGARKTVLRAASKFKTKLNKHVPTARTEQNPAATNPGASISTSSKIVPISDNSYTPVNSDDVA